MLFDPYHRGIQLGIRTYVRSKNPTRLAPTLVDPSISRAVTEPQLKPSPADIGSKLVHEFFHPTVVYPTIFKDQPRGLAQLLHLFKRK